MTAIHKYLYFSILFEKVSFLKPDGFIRLAEVTLIFLSTIQKSLRNGYPSIFCTVQYEYVPVQCTGIPVPVHYLPYRVDARCNAGNMQTKQSVLSTVRYLPVDD